MSLYEAVTYLVEAKFSGAARTAVWLVLEVFVSGPKPDNCTDEEWAQAKALVYPFMDEGWQS